MPYRVPHFVCGGNRAELLGGEGTTELPWKWECLDCGDEFANNDVDPDGEGWEQNADE